MEHEIHWGLLVALYLFLAGAGAGAIFVSAYYVLDKKIADSRYFTLAKLSAIAGTAVLVLGVAMIVLDLTTFKSGISNFDLDKLLRFHKLFMVFVPSSIMSWGTWLLALSIPIAFLFIISFYGKLEKYRKVFARVNMVLSIGICTYTAFLLGDVVHNIVWNNSALVVLFMVSALSSGIALVLLIRIFVFRKNTIEDAYMFSKTDASVLTFEFLCVAVFAYTVSIVSKSMDISYVLSLDNFVGKLWWIGAVGIGLLVPLFINIYAVTLKKQLSHLSECILIVCLLGGAFCLRYSVLLAGQMY